MKEINVTSMVSQAFPWIIALLLLSVALIYFIRRASALQREMATRSSAMELAVQEQIAAKERLLAREAELDRQRVDWEKQLANMSTEKGQERQRYEGLTKEYAQLQADLAAQQTKVQRLDELTKERDSARDSLELIRREKGTVDANLAALQSQTEEEHKATEERTRLHAKAELTAREVAQVKIGELTIERDSAREQLEQLRKGKNAVDASLAALQSQLEEEHKATEERISLNAKAETMARETSSAKINELTTERDSARDQLNFLRKEKNTVDASLAALQSQLEEEHKATEERILLHAKAETTARETSLAKINELTTERDNARDQLDVLRNEKNTVDASLAALQSQTDEEHKAAEERARLHAKAETMTLETSQAKINELTTERDSAREQLDVLRQEKSILDTDHATMLSKLDEERKSAREKIELLEQAEERLAKEFENLANRIFEEKHQKFSEVSKTGVEALLTPMREQMSDFRKKVEDVYDSENRERASLRTEIQSLKSLNERIGVDALNLTKALKGDSKTRGTWGEIQLERLLEESGLAKGREYDVQISHRNEDGQRLQPDVVVHLPEKKDVVIDSKVSLVAYEQYYTADSDEERQRHLRAHVTSLRTHFNGLSAKNYDELIGVNSLDLVIMFVPIEPALLLAFEHEANLFSEAFARRILLVSPSTLMATLQIIHNIWRYEYQNRNAQTIAAEAGKLHDQFVNFVDALEKVGDQIKRAGESYDTAHKRLTSGKGNLVGRTQKLKVLGAKVKKAISSELLEAAFENDEGLALLSEESIITDELATDPLENYVAT